MATFTSNLGTRINVGSLSGKPLNRIRTLANSGYGTKAQTLATRAQNRIPKRSPPLTAGPEVLIPQGEMPTSGTPTAPPKRNVFTSKFGTKIDVTGIEGNQLKRIQDLANTRYGDKAKALALRIKKNGVDPVTSTPTPTPTPTAPQNPIAPTDLSGITNPTPADPNNPNQVNDIINTLFPNTRMFEPKNYEGSPLYKFQVQEGQKQLAKSLAAKGLTNSGKAIEEELNIPLRVAAQDTDRMTRIASENADRLKSFQDAEALRRERVGNSQWDRLLSVAQLMAQQSPWTGALAGLNNTADISKQAGEAQANFLRDAYKRIIASGGGGGGGGGRGGSGAQPIPVPTGPDYSSIIPAQIKGDYSSNNGWINLLTNGLANLF